MKWAILIVLVVTLLADVYIYRGIVCKYTHRLPGRMAYIVFAMLTGLAGLSIFLLYGAAAGRGSGAVITVMWCVWLFFMTALPRLFFSVGAFIDWLISVFVRRRIIIFRPLAIFFSVGAIVMMIYGATAGRTKIKVNEVTVLSEHLPDSFDGYRIALFSDMHYGTMTRPEKFTRKMAGLINSLDADLVVNAGDIVNISYRDLTPEIAAELTRIESLDGVVSVYGNHDLGFYIKDSVSLSPAENVALLKETLDSMGWKTLNDESYYIYRGGDSILVAGLNFPPDGRLSGHNTHLSGVDLEKTFAGADPGSYSVVVSHAPQMWDEITNAGFGDLTLSGHVHAMQVKLKLFGRWWSPSKYIYREWSGLYENRNKYLYVNDGMGCVGYPMRIGAWPELTLITLRVCQNIID